MKLAQTLTCLVFLFGSPLLSAQVAGETEPTEESMKALGDAMERLEGAFKEKSDVDQIHFGKAVADAYKGGDSKQQAAAVKLLGKMLKQKTKDVVLAGIDYLGKTGDGAAKLLLREAKGKGKKDVNHLCACIKALGPLKDAKAADDLLKYLLHKDTVVIVHAINALGEYKGTPTKVRKEIVEQLSKVYSSVDSNAAKTNPNTADEQKYKDTRKSFEAALRALTGETTVDGAPNWARWFRKEGKKKKEW